VTVFASHQREFLEESEMSTPPKISTTRPKAKPITRPKAKTFPQANTVTPNIGDKLSYLLDGGGTKKSGGTTTKKSSSKTFVVPTKIGSKDVMSILQEEKEVILSGRKALLNEFKASSSIETQEKLKAKKNVCAILKRQEKENDPQRIGKQSPPKKVISAEYDVFDGDEEISLDVVLKVEFIKVKKTKKRNKE